MFLYHLICVDNATGEETLLMNCGIFECREYFTISELAEELWFLAIYGEPGCHYVVERFIAL